MVAVAEADRVLQTAPELQMAELETAEADDDLYNATSGRRPGCWTVAPN